MIAFQPPQQQRQLSPESMKRFSHIYKQKTQDFPSYLSVLPTELREKVKDYHLNNLYTLIAEVRSEFLNNQELENVFLNNTDFNEDLINEFVSKFLVSNDQDTPDLIEHKKTILKRNAGLLLNTPASMQLVKTTIPEGKILSVSAVFQILTAYLNTINVNYKKTLEYIKQYVRTVQLFHITQSEALVNDIVPYLIDKFRLVSEHTIPELKVLTDIGTSSAQALIMNILESHSRYRNENARLLGVLLQSQKVLLYLQQYDQVRDAVCISLENILKDALRNNDHERIAFIKGTFLFLKEPHASYKKCIAEKFEWLWYPDSKLAVQTLINAITSKQIDVIRALTEGKYVNVNVCDQFGHNALWYARNLETEAGTRLAIIKLLERAGATEEGACAIQ